MSRPRTLRSWNHLNRAETTIIFLNSDCYSKLPRTGGLGGEEGIKQKKLVSHSFGGKKVQDQDAGGSSSWWSPLPDLHMDIFLPVSLCGGEPRRERKQPLSCVLYKGTDSPHPTSWAPPGDLITSHRPHPLRPSHWELGFVWRGGGRDTNVQSIMFPYD